MRKNIDPFDEHTDEALWNALEEVRVWMENQKLLLNLNANLNKNILNKNPPSPVLKTLSDQMWQHFSTLDSCGKDETIFFKLV